MKENYKSIGRQLLSLTMALLIAMPVFTTQSYAQDYYPPGQHWIPTSLISGINFNSEMKRVSNTAEYYIELQHAPVFTELSKLGKPTMTSAYYNHAQLKEASEKGLLSYSSIRISASGWGSGWNTPMLSLNNGGPSIVDKLVIGLEYTGNYVMQSYNQNNLSLRTEANDGHNQNTYTPFSITYETNSTGGIFTSNVSNYNSQHGLSASVTHVLVNIAQDTTAIGRVETTVQQLPTTLNNAVTNINNQLANQILGTVQIMKDSPQKASILSQYGLATNIIVSGIYPSAQGGKYRVVFYNAPTNIDQLNLT